MKLLTEKEEELLRELTDSLYQRGIGWDMRFKHGFFK